ncbi:hypothetical protein FJT64_019532 [Amphibalanus amphitrite]|uniref:Uncharacterized protein n=1 Tax=Amphibalanus amphitrite TaxID=1232801 RepID=A0A6A4WTL8_AMPAM|nr:hypothetical protein FJT64_019532 [Amphibalanus amphitrite]
MERIMKQMSTVSQKLNAAKISSNIRALKQELWGSVDSLASDSLASDYSLSLDSRYMMTDPSWRTYSLETGYSRDGAPPATAGYSLESTADVASAVSRLARSVSQLSLEMETAAGDDVSLPAETGAELSELGADGEEAADLVDGVVELRHDGANAVRRYESLEALQSARAEPPAPADSWPFEPRPDGDGAQGNGEVPGRTPEREPRTVSFRLGGDAGHLLASCRVDGDCLPPESAVLIRETETRAGRPGAAAADGAIQTSLQLEIRGMEATPAPPRADWTRLQAAVSSAGAVRRGRAGLTGWLAV